MKKTVKEDVKGQHQHRSHENKIGGHLFPEKVYRVIRLIIT